MKRRRKRIQSIYIFIYVPISITKGIFSHVIFGNGSQILNDLGFVLYVLVIEEGEKQRNSVLGIVTKVRRANFSGEREGILLNPKGQV